MPMQSYLVSARREKLGRPKERKKERKKVLEKEIAVRLDPEVVGM